MGAAGSPPEKPSRENGAIVPRSPRGVFAFGTSFPHRFSPAPFLYLFLFFFFLFFGTFFVIKMRRCVAELLGPSEKKIFEARAEVKPLETLFS